MRPGIALTRQASRAHAFATTRPPSDTSSPTVRASARGSQVGTRDGVPPAPLIAVGTPITERPPHRSVRAGFPHTACMGLFQSSFFSRCRTPFPPHEWLGLIHRPAPIDRRRVRRRRPVDKLALLLGHKFIATITIRGEPAIKRETSRRNLVFGWTQHWVRTMKQQMRFGSEAPGRRAHSPDGTQCA